MDQLLKDVIARLAAEVPELKYIDIDWGQLSYFNPNPPVKMPCALVDLMRSSWSNVLKKAQLGNIAIRIRVADVQLTSSSATAPQAQRDAALAIFSVLEKVHKALHGWAGNRHYSKLMRTDCNRIEREDGVRMYEAVYSTELSDSSAQPTQQTAALSPQIAIA